MSLRAELEGLTVSLRSALEEAGVRVALVETVLIAVPRAELEAREAAAERAGIPRGAVCLDFRVRLEPRGERFASRYVVGEGRDLLDALDNALDMAARVGWFE